MRVQKYVLKNKEFMVKKRSKVFTGGHLPLCLAGEYTRYA